MRDLASRTKLIAVLAITALLVVLGILNLRDRLRATPLADDGITWVNTPNGVQARDISIESPLAFSVRNGDYVRFIFYRGKYEKIDTAETLYLYLDRQGVGNDAKYTIEHSDPVLQSLYGLDEALYDVDFKVAAREKRLERGLYLAFVGVVYLAIGLFVLFKQSRAALTYHFYALALVSFIFYFFSSTREFNDLDKLVFILDASALALIAPIFLHFCANFPSGRGLSFRARPLTALLYLPAAALITLESLYCYKPDVFAGLTLDTVRDWLDWAGLVQLGVFLVAGSGLLIRTFRRSQKPLLRQQLKWIIWGLGLSILPLTAFYIAPFVAGVRITPLMEALAYGPLILVPLSFGYSIIRYRLMDVDVIMRRSFVHVMATVAVGAIYMAVLLGVGDLVKFIWATADLNSGKTRVVVVAGMLVVAMLFAPIKKKLQEWADRWFYGERYTLRTQLQEFGRTLAQTTALPHLLDSLVRRLSEMLSVRRVAIFIEDLNAPSGFRLAHGWGIESEIALPEDIKRIIRIRSIGRGFIMADDLSDVNGLRQLAEYY
ncbi:MAG TPA: hypothetical protein VLD57_03775, partial [Blastocatellia bacterium]|nr:hypothetical protein [Blastocatellia bacterium]